MASSSTPSQSRMSILTQDLFEALILHRWGDARILLQRPGFHLELPETGPSVTPYFLLACCDMGMPVDILRAALGAMKTEDYKAPVEEISSPDQKRNILHAVLICAVGDVARIQVFVERCPELLLAIDDDGRAPIELPSALDCMDAHEGREFIAVDIIAMILRVYPEASKWHNQKGQDLLHQAIVRGSSMDFLQAVLHADPDLLYGIYKDGRTVFHHAALEGRADVLQLLLSKNNSKQMLMMTTNRGMIPLHVAALFAKNAEAVDVLVQALAESNHLFLKGSLACLRKGPRGQELLPENINDDTLATLTCLGSIARTLMSGAGAPLPLHALLRCPNFDVVFAGALFCACRAELNVRDENGDLPIHILARQEAHDLSYSCAVKVVVHLYPEGCRMPDADGKLPLELMAHSGHTLRENDMRVLLEAHPAAVENLLRHPRAICELLSLLGRSENLNALRGLLTGLPHLIRPNKRP